MEQKKRRFDKYHVLYTTLPGSIICAAGIGLGKSKTRIYQTFVKLRNMKDFELSIDNITAWLEQEWPDFKTDDFYAHSVLISDKDGLMTPLVTNWILTDNGEAPYITILPLSPDGVRTGILNYCDNELFVDRIIYDFLDEEDEEDDAQE